MHRAKQSSRWWAYDDIGDSYEAVAVPHYFAPVAEHLVADLRPLGGSRLLDAGAGTAIVASTALRKHEHVRVVATDLSLTMLRQARKRGVPSIVADIFRQPFSSHAFDAITVSFVLNHLAECGIAVLELRRILRPEGRLAVTSWATGPTENDLGEAWNAIASKWIDGEALRLAVSQALPSEKKLAELAELEAVLAHAGLRVRQSRILDLAVRMPMASYIESRSIAMASRFMITRLRSQKWNAFKREVTAVLVRRFGEVAAFSAKVNIVVAVRPA